MREDREVGRWLAYRIGMLVLWHRGEVFAGEPAPTGLAAIRVGVGLSAGSPVRSPVPSRPSTAA